MTISIGGDPVPGSKSFLEFIDEKSNKEPDVEIHGDDIFQIQYTAGTTGLPKGVIHSHIYIYTCILWHWIGNEPYRTFIYRD